jgi:ribosomal protein S18 acetylase RimI-like enzyme
MKIKLREGTLEDSDDFIELFNLVEALHRENKPNIFKTPPDDFALSFFKEILADVNAKIFVAELDSKVIGYVYVLIRAAPNNPILKPNRFLHIEQLAVSPKARRAKVGSQLMKRAENFAKDNKISEIKLNVWKFNVGAEKFYEEIGYEPERTFFSKKIDT